MVLEKALEKLKLQRDTQNLRERVRERYRFHNIVGDAPELQAVFDVVKRAAPTRATVLILGESGTGKELIAQALHEESPRRDRPFIKVNCAALSETLLESELFGHEKGAFTGAVGRKEGRFELADGGTLFLDEIGDISPALQIKLLRVLQQREFERVGGTQTLKVDVRLVAATNRDLLAEVKAGKFREDLYYRLNVVAVTLPPLRQRKGDIPALVSHFIEKYCAGVRQGDPRARRRGRSTRSCRTTGPATSASWRTWSSARSCSASRPSSPPTICRPRSVALGRASASPAPSSPARRSTRSSARRSCGRSRWSSGSTSRAAEILGISVRKIQYRLKEYSAGVRSDGPAAGHRSRRPPHDDPSGTGEPTSSCAGATAPAASPPARQLDHEAGPPEAATGRPRSSRRAGPRRRGRSTRPRPEPCALVVKKGSKICSRAAGGMPPPLSSTGRWAIAPGGPDRRPRGDPHRAAGGRRLEGVQQQIHEHLAELRLLARDRRKPLREGPARASAARRSSSPPRKSSTLIHDRPERPARLARARVGGANCRKSSSTWLSRLISSRTSVSGSRSARLRLLRELLDPALEHLELQRGGVERVADLVGEPRGHRPDGRELLGDLGAAREVALLGVEAGLAQRLLDRDEQLRRRRWDGRRRSRPRRASPRAPPSSEASRPSRRSRRPATCA